MIVNGQLQAVFRGFGGGEIEIVAALLNGIGGLEVVDPLAGDQVLAAEHLGVVENEITVGAGRHGSVGAGHDQAGVLDDLEALLEGEAERAAGKLDPGKPERGDPVDNPGIIPVQFTADRIQLNGNLR